MIPEAQEKKDGFGAKRIEFESPAGWPSQEVGTWKGRVGEFRGQGR